jgi:transporter family-2 protein
VNPTAIAIAVMLFGGVCLSLQAPTNAALSRGVGSPISAAFISFLVGTVGLLVVVLALREKPDIAATRALPGWAWMGGLYGAVLVAATAYAAPRIGIASALTLSVAAQLTAAVTLDHFGALGLPQRPVDSAKVVGLLLVGAGVVLVRRGWPI